MKPTPAPNRILNAAGIAVVCLFSLLLMFHTFSYDGKRSEMRIATKLWSDFGAHIPLIRSFSLGPNTERLLTVRPVESPLYPGEPIRYHFGFYALVGVLERLGLRIDWALNILSAAGFAGLILMIYAVSRHMFGRSDVAALSILFFLFNGSLSFMEFFSEHPLSVRSLGDIVTNPAFPSFGPWDNGNITAFWTLNIYTNQRHLALSYALVLASLFTVLGSVKTVRNALIIGAATGITMFTNFASFAITVLFLGWTFVVKKDTRKTLLFAAAVVTVCFAILRLVSNTESAVAWEPGYLTDSPVTLRSFVLFWWENLGLHSVLIPLGIILSPRSVRRILVPPLIVLFVLPNLYRFSPDMINNHKFFNFFLIVGNMFSAYAVIGIMTGIAGTRLPRLRSGPVSLSVARILVGVTLIMSLVLSGIIDLFPIINDQKGSVADIPANGDARFILDTTSPTDIVANSTWFYHPASIAGRPVFSGYTYFTWSYGYNQVGREEALQRVYRTGDVTSLCRMLNEYDIPYIELSGEPESYLKPNRDLWDSLPAFYNNPDTHRTIYARHQLCVQ